MFECVSLARKNINILRSMNEQRISFNEINKDFFEVYDKSNFAQQIFLRRNVFLLKNNTEYCGYLWLTKEGKYTYNIESMYVMKNIKADIDGYSTLINEIPMYSTLEYTCQDNPYNNNILNALGFIAEKGTIELIYNFDSKNLAIPLPENVGFQQFIEGRDESLRCKIQNTVFKSNSRIPLTVDDIYYDEAQKYYIQDASFFIKENEVYVGYGQVIMENSYPVIVNVGILSEYRKKRYGRYLLLKLLEKIKDLNFKSVKIRVSSDNFIALNLYKDIGFKPVHYKYLWKLERK